jgi:DNA polymerase-3 subunit beta
MKFTCDKNAFVKKLAVAKETAEKNFMSILSCVRLEARESRLEIRAANSKSCFEAAIEAEVDEPGASIVNAGKLLDICKSLPSGTIGFEDDESKVVVRPEAKEATFWFRRLSDNVFPEFPVCASKPATLPAKSFKDMTRQTVFAVSDDETRYFLNGVFMEKEGDDLVMVASNGVRLAFARHEASGLEFPSSIVPTPILKTALKHFDDEGSVGLSVSNGHIFIEHGPHKLSSELIRGEFPNYRRVVSKSWKHGCSASRDDMLKAVKRTVVLASRKRVWLEIKSGCLAICARDGDTGDMREEISCEYEGPDALIPLNCRYLEDACKAIEGETVFLCFSEEHDPITLKPSAGEYFHIITPMKAE